MACRAQWDMLAKCGQFTQILPAIEELHRFQLSRGMKDTRIWLPVTGQSNRVIIETEFDSMAHLEKELETTLSDKAHLALREKIAAHTVDGSSQRSILRSFAVANFGHLTGK